jgi:hypothetical protein
MPSNLRIEGITCQFALREVGWGENPKPLNPVII